MSYISSIHIEISGVHRLHHIPAAKTELLRYMAAIGASKVYLEGYRGWDAGLGDYDQNEHRVSDEILMAVADDFRSRGILVAGEMAAGSWEKEIQPPAKAPKHIFDQVSCLNHLGTQQALIGVAEQLARHTDEILLDDWLSHRCYCDTCLQGIRKHLDSPIATDQQLRDLIDCQDPQILDAYQEHAWETVRHMSLLLRDAAKAINPGLQFHWKLPNWHRDYLFHGIDLLRLADVYDGFWIGTEIREEMDEYASLLIWNLVKSQVGEKLKGTWFDFLHGSWSFDIPMGTQRYLEQFRLSALTGCQEIVFCSYPILCDARYQEMEQAVRQNRPVAIQVNEKAQQLVGVPTRRFAAKRAMFMPDGYLCDTLGNYGVPILPIPKDQTPQAGELITQWSASHLSPKDFETDNIARDLIFTADAALTWVERGFSAWLGLDEALPINRGIIETQEFELPGSDKTIPTCDHAWSLAPMTVSPIFQPGNASVVLTAIEPQGQKHPVALEYQNGVNRIRILGLTRYRSMYRNGYPEQVRQLLRDWVGDIVGIKLFANNRQAALQKVILAPYKEQIVLINLNPHPVRFELWLDANKFPSKPQGLFEQTKCDRWQVYPLVLETYEMRQILLSPTTLNTK
ncbi:MAG: hypothetical protein JKX85_12655 [Phycisphaeraceae bacterium]|nr:hypothetical protein [Phycisphaeraceae bacterium]